MELRAPELWPQPKPLPEDRPPVVEFDYDLLPEKLRAYVADVSHRMQCRPDYIAVSTLCALAGIVGRKARINPKQLDNWEVTPTLWGAMIGGPSTKKSPSLIEALKPLEQLESESRELYRGELDQFEINQKVYRLESKNAESKASKMIARGDRQGASTAIADTQSGEPVEPTPKRIVINDTSVAKLGELLNQNPNGLLLKRDELSGWFSEMLKEERQSDRAFFLEAYNGNGSYTFDRIGRGTIFIESCCLSIIGGIQPAKLAPIVRGAVNGTSDDGLLQRFQLMVWPDSLTGARYIDQRPNQAAMSSYSAVFRRLAMLDTGPVFYRFKEEAQKLFIEWYQENLDRCQQSDTPPAIESYLIKMEQTVAKLALLFALIEGESQLVGVESLARALEWSDYLLSHAYRVYSIAINNDIHNAKLILTRKERFNNPFKAREIARKEWPGLSSTKSVQCALDLLIDHDYLVANEIPAGNAGGRPTFEYVWNPRTK
ncbi:DUF3987 domain-containing protein [Candidatus Kaiserbacteria bacterium]|nr:DUF3987 domain-containing protein [Candidatus Kaiserbacteria bacterium]